jgi:hypothetical protein
METTLVIFLAFVSIALFMNTVLIWLVYKALAGLTWKVTKNVSNFTAGNETKAWLTTLQSTSERMVAATEATKLRLAESGPAIERAQQSYRNALAKVDSTLDTVANEVTVSAEKARDLMAGPASSIFAFAAGVAEFLQNFETGE